MTQFTKLCFLWNRPVPSFFTLRLVYFDLAGDAIANKAAREAIGSTLNDKVPDLIKKMAGTEVESMKHNIFREGSKAAREAVKALEKAAEAGGRKVTEEEARAVAKAAVDKVAKAEIDATRELMKNGIKTAAEKVAEKAAARAAAERATTEAAKRAGVAVAENAGGRTGSIVLAEEAAPAAASAGVTAAAVLAAVVAWGFVVYNGYKLYKETDGLTNTESGSDVTKRLTADAEERWNVNKIDTHTENGKTIEGDLPREAQIAGSELRGASKLARDCSSDILVAVEVYGDLRDKTIDKAELTKMLDYSKEIMTRITAITSKPGMDVNSPEYKEAMSALINLGQIISMANKALAKDEKADSAEVKLAKAEKEKAILERDKTDIHLFLNSMSAKLKTLNVDEKATVELQAKIDSLLGKSLAAKNNDELKQIAQELKPIRVAFDSLVLEDKNVLTEAQKNEVVIAFIRTKVKAENMGDSNLIMAAYGSCLAQYRNGMNAKDFTEKLTSIFPTEINQSSLLKNDGYFAESQNAGGKKQFENYLWLPQAQGYVLGLVTRAKNLPDIKGLDTYNAELKKTIGSSEWQAKATDAWSKGGEAAFMAYVTSTLPTAEAYFHIEDKPKAEDKKAKAVASGGGGGGYSSGGNAGRGENTPSFQTKTDKKTGTGKSKEAKPSKEEKTTPTAVDSKSEYEQEFEKNINLAIRKSSNAPELEKTLNEEIAPDKIGNKYAVPMGKYEKEGLVFEVDDVGQVVKGSVKSAKKEVKVEDILAQAKKKE